MKKPVLRSELVEITPAKAEAWLELNNDNRNISDKWVDAIADDILNNRWDPNNASIGMIVDSKDNPIKVADGQHRLWAIVHAKKAIWTLVVFGDADNLKRENIDRVKPRAVSDQLQLLYGVKSARRVTACCSVIKALEAAGAGHDVLTLEQALALREHHKVGFEWGLNLAMGGSVTNNNRIGVGPVLGPLIYAYPTSPDKLDHFALQVRDGENITRQDPAYALRTYLERLQQGSPRSGVQRAARHEIMVMTLRAIMAAIRGEKLSALKPGAIMGGGFYREACKYFARAHAHVAGSLGVTVRKRSA